MAGLLSDGARDAIAVAGLLLSLVQFCFAAPLRLHLPRWNGGTPVRVKQTERRSGSAGILWIKITGHASLWTATWVMETVMAVITAGVFMSGSGSEWLVFPLFMTALSQAVVLTALVYKVHDELMDVEAEGAIFLIGGTACAIQAAFFADFVREVTSSACDGWLRFVRRCFYGFVLDRDRNTDLDHHGRPYSRED